LNRKPLAVKAEVAEKLSEIARRKNLTLFSLVTEALEQLLKIEDKGENLKKVVEQHLILSAAKKAGFILTPQPLLFSLLEKTFTLEGEFMAKIWRESGEWLGYYFKTIDPAITSKELLENIVKGILWNISEFSVTSGNEGLTVKCILFQCPKPYAVLLAEFISGVVSSLNYKPSTREITRGIILLNFRRE
jgi:hypothetical protein